MPDDGQCPVCFESFSVIGKTTVCGDARHQICKPCQLKLNRCPVCRKSKKSNFEDSSDDE